MRDKPQSKNGDEIVDVFGKKLAEAFDYSLIQSKRRLEDSILDSDIEFRRYLNVLSRTEKYQAVAQEALETFIHEFLFMIQDSLVFKLVGILESGEEVDLKDFAPEGLHGNQLDWLEEYGSHPLIESIIYDREKKQKQN